MGLFNKHKSDYSQITVLNWDGDMFHKKPAIGVIIQVESEDRWMLDRIRVSFINEEVGGKQNDR